MATYKDSLIARASHIDNLHFTDISHAPFCKPHQQKQANHLTTPWTLTDVMLQLGVRTHMLMVILVPDLYVLNMQQLINS